MGLLGMPKVQITFVEEAVRRTKQQEQGIVALILRDTIGEGVKKNFEVHPDSELPSFLSEENKKQIKLALMGHDKRPKKVIVYVISPEEDYTEALNWLEIQNFQYLAVPTVETDNKAKVIADWITKCRRNKKLCKGVLPNYKGDKEYLINYATDLVYQNEECFTTEQYCSRIAGLLAGTSLTISCTYAVLEEVTDCSRLTLEEMNAAVGEGKLIVFHDGEKVKVARGVNSLTTIGENQGDKSKKIKIIEARDSMSESLEKTIQDVYIGQVANSFDNKCLLLTEIQDFFEKMKKEEIVSDYSVEFDLEGIKAYLEKENISTEELTEEEIIKEDTGEQVFFKVNAKILDVMEEIGIKIAA